MQRKKTKLFKNIKANLALNNMEWVVNILFLVATIFVTMFLIRMLFSYQLDVKDVQAEVLVSSLIYSKNGVGYYDEITGRSYPEIIHLEQLDNRNLTLSFYYPENNLITVRIEVYSKNADGDKNQLLGTYYYNKEWWDNWDTLRKMPKIKGLGSVHTYEKNLPVLYYIDDEQERLKMGMVTYTVVQPR